MTSYKHETQCSCGWDVDHKTIFNYWDDDNTFIVHSGLNHYLPWYKRIVVGIKYILGIDNTHHFYTESVLEREEVVSLWNYIDNCLRMWEDEKD